MPRFPAVTITSRNGQGIFDCPSVIQAPTNSLFRHADNSSPFRERVGLPSKSNKAIDAGIVRLLKRRRPTAVGGGVVAVWIDAIYRVILAGAQSHIVKKILEGFAPTGTDLDTTAAVKIILGIVRVGAPLVHSAPRLMLWRPRHAVCLCRLTRPTSTASGGVSFPEQGRPAHDNGSAATAFAQPTRHLLSVLSYVANNDQLTERAAGQVFSNALRNGYNLVSHVRTSNASMMRGLRGVRSALQSPLLYHSRTDEQRGATPA